MKQWQKTMLIFCSLLGMVISFTYHIRNTYIFLDEIIVPVHVNIEIDKAYLHNVSILAGFVTGEDTLFPLSAEGSNEIRTVILHSEIYRDRSQGFSLINALFLCVPIKTAQKTLDAIGGISIFIGKKLFYFAHSDVINLEGNDQSDYVLYKLPGLEYKKSVTAALLRLPPFINWYGDLNLAVKAAGAFFIYPGRFIITWCFFICFFVLCRPAIEKIYSFMRKQKTIPELVLFVLIVLIGFVLRLNGYDRYSLWNDELYSAGQGSNPGLPFMNTFEDPGNPPFYFIMLRLWFMLFGWTEQSGRLFSVLTGCAAIITLYILVKHFVNKKAAFLAALYMALSAPLIGLSQNMRGYILQVFLVSIVVFRFLVIMQKRELDFINLVWYIIPSVLLVNTHYFGSLFVFVNFLFYFFYSAGTKTFTWKKTILFFTGNLLIAFSLLPFFVHTALQRALLDSGFNPDILKPGLMLICIAAFIPLLGILYMYMRRTVFQRTLSHAHNCFLDYAFFSTSVLYLIAFAISLYRPILIPMYLVILYPLLFAVVAIIFINVITRSSKLIGGLCICFAFSWIVAGYSGERSVAMNTRNVYHESLAFISRDADAHPQQRSVSIEFIDETDVAGFYGYRRLPLYVYGDSYDVLYINALFANAEQGIYSNIASLGISPENVLRIHIDNSFCVFKVYSP